MSAALQEETRARQEEATLPDPLIGPHTIQEWLDLPSPEDGSSVELIFGHFHVTPPPSGEHQLAVTRLIRPMEDSISAAGRTDLYAVIGVGVKISSTLRNGFIPDVVIMDRPPTGASFPAEALRLAVEVWSPGNTRNEREAKMAAYAVAGVPFLWTISRKGDHPGLELTAHRLHGDQYAVDNTVRSAGPTTITAAPIPVTLDLADLVF
ncbi:Uma2 family endonuclease [Saccharothrix carnea]|uniref:Uma2 family endonuclease n=1 Tax=Saccharothrix carnea TaxID=1280637 RepID=A0A2P8I8H4_SACCR|nr:Uma2 family endonuclease [Saccharothrix carnea]PSL54764.1 Uma2 family endonuclease [Saccharothrix carnea]